MVHEAVTRIIGIVQSLQYQSCPFIEQDMNHGRKAPGVKILSANQWEQVVTDLQDVRVQLADRAIPCDAFQALLVAAIREMGNVTPPPGNRALDYVLRPTSENAALHLGKIWCLHESGILPLSQLLETSETIPGCNVIDVPEESRVHRRNWVESVVRDVTILALKSKRSGSMEDPKLPCSRGHDDSGWGLSGRYGVSSQEVTLLAKITRHLFDLGYRHGDQHSSAEVGMDLGSIDRPATVGSLPSLPSRVARTVLDRLCCGTIFLR